MPDHSLTRRGFVQQCLAIASTTTLARAVIASDRMVDSQAGQPRAERPGEEMLDAALERLANTGPEFGGGLANHGPMAAEALVALRRPEAVEPWVTRYRRGLQEHPSVREPIRPELWADALGRIDLVGDWIALFERQLAESPWPAVLSTWAPRLAPGLVGAATHGVIRTGHAARGLAARETAGRRRELAQGLGYWAARFRRLPEERRAAPPSRRPSQALRDVALVPVNERKARRLITDALEALDGFPPFAAVADAVDSAVDPSAFLSDLTSVFARVYLDQAPHRRNVITFIHGVTGPSAARLLLPHLEPAARPALLRYAWQAAAGLYAALGETPSPEGAFRPGGDVQMLIDRAVASGDEHAIKFTEACLREHGVTPSPVFLEAAWDAVQRLGG